MRKILLAFMTVLMIACKERNKLKIYPLSPYSVSDYAWNTSDSGKTTTDSSLRRRMDYYVIKGYSEHDTSTVHQQIRRFTDTAKAVDYNVYSFYAIYFYKESTSTDTSFRENRNDLVDYHQKDLVATFRWVYGIPQAALYYANGKLEE